VPRGKIKFANIHSLFYFIVRIDYRTLTLYKDIKRGQPDYIGCYIFLGLSKRERGGEEREI